MLPPIVPQGLPVPSSVVATLQDVAVAAGVSKSVASRVLNNDHYARIASGTRQRVRDAAQRLQYIPDHRARALRNLRSGAIALVVPNVTNAVFSDLFDGVQSVSSAAGSKLLLAQMPVAGEQDQTLIDVVGLGHVDGAVVQRSESMNDGVLSHLLNTSLPVVLFNSTLREREGSVVLDDAAASRVAAEHLLELGHTAIGYIGGRPEHDAARRRAEGFRSTMHSAGLAVNSEWTLEAGWEADAGSSAMIRILSAEVRPTAVIAASVNAGVGALSRALASGLEVPGDMSIVAIQDTWVAEMFRPSLTVVRLPLREAGAAAATMLMAALEGGPMSDVVGGSVSPALVVRSTTARRRHDHSPPVQR